MVLSTLNGSACLDERRIVSVVDLPPKDPRDDDHEDEEDEDEDEDEEEGEEPAIIREPDER